MARVSSVLIRFGDVESVLCDVCAYGGRREREKEREKERKREREREIKKETLLERLS